jgi:hypothetical protein
MVFWVCCFGESWGQVTVNADDTWSPGNPPPAGYEDGITINPGISLTIIGSVLDMNSGKSITLGLGSKLSAENTTFQATGLGSNTWSGIRATGGSSTEQYTTFPDPKTKNSTAAWQGVLNTNQTLVSFTNVKVINATIGVESLTGAIIQTRGGEFLNCGTGVKVNTYQSATEHKVNACYFQGTDFRWDDDYDNLTGSFAPSTLKGIWLNNVRTINIGGCTFENANNTKFCINERGTGIYADNSAFTAEEEGDRFCVDPICDTNNDYAINCLPGINNPCQFNQLWQGIEFVGPSSGHNFAKMVSRFNDFTDNYISVECSNAQSLGLYENDFSTDRSTLNNLFTHVGCAIANEYYAGNTLIDVKTAESEQLRILDNEFSSNSQYVVHLFINESYSIGNTSLIKENAFKSTVTGYDDFDNVIGIQLANDNRNLNIVCNDFEHQGIDIYCTTTNKLSNQPLDGAVVGNDPSSNLSNRYHIRNDGNTFQYDVVNGGLLLIANYDGTNTVLPNANGSTPRNCVITCNDAVVGIERQKNEGTITVYPNPTSTSFSFLSQNIKLNGLMNIKIVDLNGITKYEGSFNANKSEQIDISELPSGLYFVFVYSEQENVHLSTSISIIH